MHNAYETFFSRRRSRVKNNNNNTKLASSPSMTPDLIKILDMYKKQWQEQDALLQKADNLIILIQDLNLNNNRDINNN